MLFAELDLVTDDFPASAARNMAIDEALGRHVGRPVLRVYRWSEPSVSFGYFEKIAGLYDEYSAFPLVRRWTGGGTVLHGQDFTYSLAIPRGHALACAGAAATYFAIHEAIRDFLCARGWPVALATACSSHGPGCFQRPVLFDLLLEGKKIGGAAQRRTREFLLHQGSLQNLSTANWQPADFAGFFCNSSQRRNLTPLEEQTAGDLERTRYGDPGWTNLR